MILQHRMTMQRLLRRLVSPSILHDSPTLDPLPDLSPTQRDLMLQEDSSTSHYLLAFSVTASPSHLAQLHSAQSNLIPPECFAFPRCNGTISFGPIRIDRVSQIQ